jgi:uncharacterized protein
MMSPDPNADLKPYQQELEDALLSLDADSDAMLLSQFDGFVAGLACCPDLVAPDEWMPVVFGAPEEEGAPFEDEDHAGRVTSLLLAHYDQVLADLAARVYAPIYDVDGDEVMWESWVAGFDLAVQLRGDAFFNSFEDADEETASCLNMMAALSLIDAGESDLPPASIERLSADAPDLIPQLVDTLYAWRARHAQPRIPRRAAKVGRNDPCPCGSGKKHKKCCGVA